MLWMQIRTERSQRKKSTMPLQLSKLSTRTMTANWMPRNFVQTSKGWAEALAVQALVVAPADSVAQVVPAVRVVVLKR